ncbi:MAG: T9SS type A sorting domain-containing protein [Bacteroidetes bacterium]|nr:MAG: T9SS type A sorting domain-containing protein [Bacteroidota bacterium]
MSQRHPKLYWGAYPAEDVLYRIKRKVGTNGWETIASTTNREYTDIEVTVANQYGGNNTEILYKVIAVVEPIEVESNTVRYETAGWGLDKKGQKKDGIVYETKLEQNYPNPWNPISRIKYQVSKKSRVTIKIYDMLSREIAELVNEEKEAGEYEIEFNGSKLPSGIYLYEMRAGNYRSVKKMNLIK